MSGFGKWLFEFAVAIGGAGLLFAAVFFLLEGGRDRGKREARIDEAKRWCAQNPNYAPAFRVNGKDARCVEGRLYFTEAGE